MVEIVEDGTMLANHFRTVSLQKLSWAREALLQLDDDLQDVLTEHCVVFLSGDIAYYLAHETKRTHSQLRVEVNGADIDIVIVTNREVPPEKSRVLKANYSRQKNLSYDPAYPRRTKICHKANR